MYVIGIVGRRAGKEGIKEGRNRRNGVSRNKRNGEGRYRWN